MNGEIVREKGRVTFPKMTDIVITWGPHGRHTIKRKGTAQPVGFIAPQNWKWQLQTNPSLSPIGEPIDNRDEALLNAAKHFTKEKTS